MLNNKKKFFGTLFSKFVYYSRYGGLKRNLYIIGKDEEEKRKKII